MELKFVVRDKDNQNNRFITLDEFEKEFSEIKLQFNKGYLLDIPYLSKEGIIQILITN
jgi:hypothetical protein